MTAAHCASDTCTDWRCWRERCREAEKRSARLSTLVDASIETLEELVKCIGPTLPATAIAVEEFVAVVRRGRVLPTPPDGGKGTR